MSKVLSDYMTTDDDIPGRDPFFKGTRVPAKCLFQHRKEGISLREFLDDFDSVTNDQLSAVFEIARESGNDKGKLDLKC
jgi:uncharacterized protein (DUF433 family)